MSTCINPFDEIMQRGVGEGAIFGDPAVNKNFVCETAVCSPSSGESGF